MEVDVNKIIDLLIVIFTTLNFVLSRVNAARIARLHDRVTTVEENGHSIAKNGTKGSV